MAKVMGLAWTAAPGETITWAAAKEWVAARLADPPADMDKDTLVAWVRRRDDNSIASVNLDCGDWGRRRTFRIDPYDILHPPRKKP